MKQLIHKEKTTTIKRGPPISGKNNLFWKWRDAFRRVRMSFATIPVVYLLALFVCTFAVLDQSYGGAAQDKAVFLILGDSVMKTVSVSLERDLARSAEFRPVSFASIGSGLCRLDLLNWHEKIKMLAETENPAAAVILIGSNDNQPMQTEKDGVLRQGSDEWQAEYAQRAGKCMDIMIAGGIKNIIWVSLPDMREPDRQEHVRILNNIFSKEAASRPAVVILDTQKIFSREPGKFTMYVFGTDGKPLYVRAQDGVHFNREGANRLAEIIVKKLKEVRKKRQDTGRLAPHPGFAGGPAEVRENS